MSNIDNLVLQEQPYKLLDYYDSKDAGNFFGREKETAEVAALILCRHYDAANERPGIPGSSNEDIPHDPKNCADRLCRQRKRHQEAK